MSEETTTPTTPASLATPAATPDAGAVTTAAQPVTQTPAAEQPFATFPDAKSFNAKVGREARKLMNQQAKEAGFDDWEHMQESVAATRQPPAATPTPGPEGTAAATPAAPAQPDEASRLRMALQIGTELNVPTALVARLQGATADEMRADATALLGLMTAPRGPGIPPAVQQGHPVTFTRKQIQDPAYVREHQAEILQAAREGRIVDS